MHSGRPQPHNPSFLPCSGRAEELPARPGRASAGGINFIRNSAPWPPPGLNAKYRQCPNLPWLHRLSRRCLQWYERHSGYDAEATCSAVILFNIWSCDLRLKSDLPLPMNGTMTLSHPWTFQCHRPVKCGGARAFCWWRGPGLPNRENLVKDEKNM